MKRVFLISTLFFGFFNATYAKESLLPNADDNAGVIFFNQKNYTQAENYFQAKVDEPLEQELAHVYLAKIAVLRHEGEAAIDHISAALAISPNLAPELILAAEAHCTTALQASIFSALKYGKKCGKYYSQAADDYPTNIDALKHAVLFHLQAPSMAGGSKKSARRYLNTLNTQSEEDARVANVLMALKNDGDKAAWALAQQYASKTFRSSVNLYELAILFRDNDDYETAVSLFQRITALPESSSQDWHRSDATFQIGEIYITQLNRPSEGIALIEQYLAISHDIYDRHYFWARWRLARAYKDQGNEQAYQALIAQIKEQDYSFNKAFVDQFENADL